MAYRPDRQNGGARGIAKQANAVVISVDYRLAPEHAFPAAHDDALAVYKWIPLDLPIVGRMAASPGAAVTDQGLRNFW
ncbi:alpha/beta hydrolase fold domain-containing protein [Pseudomonas sp. MWU16-30317]|uniref:alpha/beta hydrolase fold domain-containing protein n=1 Tax=Pseudomonas sp. MWU16-30317 TaxID=2878095 RepID=UPI0031FA2A5F